jgi:hypothetical protein
MGYSRTILFPGHHAEYYTRGIKSRRAEWVGHVAFMDGMRNAYKISVGISEGKRLL